MQSVRRARAYFVIAGLAMACGGPDAGDPHSPQIEPLPEGSGERIYEIADPASPRKAQHRTPVNITGAVVVAVDTFDETREGVTVGTIYVNDLKSKEPYSGVSLYNPSFIPGNLRVNPGDTLDLRGEYQENTDLPQQFAPGAFLAQIASPIATFRFDATVPPPIDIDIADLTDFTKGRRWLNMIVRVRNVTLERHAYLTVPCNSPCTSDEPRPDQKGRVSSRLLPPEQSELDHRECQDPFPKAPTLVNELFDFTPRLMKKGTVIKELVGLVTFHCNLHIAPRSDEDIVTGDAP